MTSKMELLTRYGPLIGFTSVILGIVGIVLTVLYFRWGRPSIKTSLLDVARILPEPQPTGLSIQFNGMPLTDMGLTLSLLTVAVQNRGWGDLLSSHYEVGSSLDLEIATSIHEFPESGDKPDSPQTLNLTYVADEPTVTPIKGTPPVTTPTWTGLGDEVEHPRISFGQPVLSSGSGFRVSFPFVHPANSNVTIRPTGRLIGLDPKVGSGMEVPTSRVVIRVLADVLMVVVLLTALVAMYDLHLR